jgi:methylphosphotriester-DNA--protein-cysteine methyltransferase
MRGMAKRIDTKKFVGMTFEQMARELHRMNAAEEMFGSTWETAVRPAAKAAGVDLDRAAIWWASQYDITCVPASYHRKVKKALGIR